MIDCVVAPLDHKLPVPEEEVKITLDPEHKVVGPFELIIGVAGNGFTTIFNKEEFSRHPPMFILTEILSVEFTVIACVVSPVDHKLFVGEDEVRTTSSP